MKQRISKGERKLLDAHAIKMRERQLDNAIKEIDSRARSFSVGTAFGGATEVTMRGDGGAHMWAVLQPVEVVELIHQMAAAVGCHIHLVPRNDFSSWRSWNYTPEELEHYRGHQTMPGVGHAPAPKARIEGGYSAELPPPEEQPGLPRKEEAKDEAMATKTSE